MSENEHENEHDDSNEAAWLLARERGQSGPIVSDATAARYARLQSMIEDLPATPGGARARAGWRQDVLAAIDAMEAGSESSSNEAPVEAPVEAPIAAPVAVPIPSIDSAMPERRRTRPARWAAASAIGVIAASVAILLAVRRHRGDGDVPTVAYEVEPAGPPHRGADPSFVPTVTYEVEPAGAPHRGADPSVGDTLVVRAVVEGPGELRIYDGHGVEQAHCAAPAPDCTVERSGNRTTLRLTMPLRVLGVLRAVLFAAPLGGTSGGLTADVDAARRAGVAPTSRDLVEVR